MTDYYRDYLKQNPSKDDTFVDYLGKIWTVTDGTGNTLTDGNRTKASQEVATNDGPLQKAEL